MMPLGMLLGGVARSLLSGLGASAAGAAAGTGAKSAGTFAGGAAQLANLPTGHVIEGLVSGVRSLDPSHIPTGEKERGKKKTDDLTDIAAGEYREGMRKRPDDMLADLNAGEYREALRKQGGKPGIPIPIQEAVPEGQGEGQTKPAQASGLVANVIGGLGKFGKAIAGPLGVTAAVLGASKAVERFGTMVVEGYRGLEKWNGRLAVMFAQMDRQSTVLGARYAAATGGSASFAGGALMGVREQLAPLSQMFGTIKNLAVGGLLKVAEGLLKGLNVILWPIKQITKALEWIVGGGGKEEASPVVQFLQAFGRGQVATGRKPQNRRPGKVD